MFRGDSMVCGFLILWQRSDHAHEESERPSRNGGSQLFLQYSEIIIPIPYLPEEAQVIPYETGPCHNRTIYMT